MKRDIKLYIQDILKAISVMETFVEDMDLEEFASNDKNIRCRDRESIHV